MEIKLPVGVQSFAQLREKGCCYVDKTPFIKTVMLGGADVLLMTRPRRFGKSLFMNTLKTFLRLDVSDPNNSPAIRPLFSGLKILEDERFCEAFMGRFPVVCITLSDVGGSTFEAAHDRLASTLLDVASEFAFLAESDALLPWERQMMQRYLTPAHLKDPANIGDIKDFLKNLVSWLCRHFGRQVVLLVDEYDVPLAKAAKNGYFKPMQEIIRSFLGQVLKPGDLSNSVKPRLFKAVLTGCLSIGKESFFPELNSPEINAVCSMDASLAEAMGFTAPEVEALLTHCGLQSRFDDVKQWYDGYRFAGREIYCPWDVVNFCQQARKADSPEKYEPENFWSSTSENAEVYEFLGFLSGDDTARMQQLLDGEIVEIRVNEKLSYGDLANHRPDDFWTILLMAGYLTVEEKLNGDCWRVRIPNREIRETFEQKVRQYFSSDGERFSEHAIAFVKAAYAGDADAMTDALSKALDGFVSVRDAATKSPAENYYHGFMNALFSNVRPLVKNYRTNGEAGAGLADIAFTSGLGSKSLGVVIEIKHRKKSEELFSAAEAALRQIEEKHCAKFFDQFRCGGRFVYGIGFSGKDCVVLGGARTDAAKASAGA